MTNLTRKQLFKAASTFPYLAVRWSSGVVTGVNSKVSAICLKNVSPDDTETQIQSYYPISFQEYIRIKVPFVKTFKSIN